MLSQVSLLILFGPYNNAAQKRAYLYAARSGKSNKVWFNISAKFRTRSIPVSKKHILRIYYFLITLCKACWHYEHITATAYNRAGQHCSRIDTLKAYLWWGRR